jgi:intein/homing endonuclease
MRPSEILPRWFRVQKSERIVDDDLVAKAQKLSKDPVEFFRQVMGFEPTTYQREFIKLFLENQFLAARWCRQCVDGETLIFLDNGTVESIKSLKGSWFTGFKRVFRVVSSSGKELICTEDHKFYTKKGWKKLKDISLGEEVFVQKQVPIFGNLTISNDRVKILAYLITDGSFKSKGQSIKFTGKEPYVTEFVSAIKKEFPDIEPKIYPKGECFDVLCTASPRGRTKILKRNANTGLITESKVQPNSLRMWLANLTFIGNMPRLVFELNRHQLALFINRLYANDGWVSVYRSKKNSLGVGKSIQIGFGSPSKQTILALQMLLLKYGIHARISEEHPTSHSKKKKPIFHIFYRLRIYDIYSMRRFFDNIGLIFGKEKRSQEAYTIIKNRIRAIEEGRCPKVTRLGPYTAKMGSGTKSLQ